MRIIYIHKALFHQRPPVISAVLALSDLGHSVYLITEGINSYWRKQLDNREIQYTIINRNNNKSLMAKAISYYVFKQKVKKYVDTISDSLLWVEGGQTIFCLERLLKKQQFVLQIQELHENSRLIFKSISRIITSSLQVFVPEYHRAILYQYWFNLKERPVVMPNKPYFFPSDMEFITIESKYNSVIKIVKKKKSIIYQGHIGPQRDLSGFVQAIKELGDDYQLVLVGQNHHNYVEKYMDIDESIIHINYLPSPDYLVFTSYAYMGIITYDIDSLNNIFCAPNKIWEYSKYGLPIICNDIPGLKYGVESYGAGLCVNEKNIDEIKEAILRIDSNYSSFSSSAFRMYNMIDNKEIIKIALDKIDV